MHNVQSKYKNPDKFIEKLKKEMDRDNNESNEIMDILNDENCDLRGENLITWADNVREDEGASGSHYGDLHVGDTIAVIGKVEKIVEELKLNNEPTSHIYYKKVCTKKVEAY